MNITKVRIFTPKCNRQKRAKRKETYVPYSSYLTSGHWAQIKEQSSAIYGHKCLVCGSGENLNHHHLFYPENKTDIRAHQVLPICGECHAAYHAIEPNGGIHKSVSDPTKIVNIIDEVFDYVNAARWPEGNGYRFTSKQDHVKRQTAWRYWTRERRRNKNLHHSPPRV